MLHHVSLGVADIERAARFYDAVLGALGYVRVWEDLSPGDDDQAVGYGLPGGGDKLAIKMRGAGARAPGPGFHLAFAAPSRDAVAAFHEAALQHGGRSNGAAGLRPDYGPDYYAAFVVDADGHHIEAVINRVP
ncbi:VOC family protein [Xanthomonas sp. GW]|uniref:VOC family protein n=1 Tax=Xanthomonas sp. GW TaxID=2724121 RepID=UPI00163A640E|nr:VOC family protein [Xanthomonas sp. GW]QNH19500.1 VOC family protein [Xanthomonas sp. GW]